MDPLIVAEALWIARAARVLPTPSSPARHTLCGEGATWAIRSQTRRMARLLPARSASRCRSRSCWRSRSLSATNRLRSAADSDSNGIRCEAMRREIPRVLLATPMPDRDRTSALRSCETRPQIAAFRWVHAISGADRNQTRVYGLEVFATGLLDRPRRREEASGRCAPRPTITERGAAHRQPTVRIPFRRFGFDSSRALGGRRHVRRRSHRSGPPAPLPSRRRRPGCPAPRSRFPFWAAG